MINKQAILDNIEEYDAPSLVQFIKDRVVKFKELCNDTEEGCFPANVRKEVAKQLKELEKEDWEEAKITNSIDLLNRYLDIHDEGDHREEARDLISELQSKQSEQKNRDEKDAEEKEVVDKWESVDKNNIDSLDKFLKEFPEHIDARRRFNELKKDEYIGYDTEALVAKINSKETDKMVNDPATAIFEVIKGYIEQKKISKTDVLKVIKEDHNTIPGKSLNKLVEKGYLSYDDFLEIGINEKFIKHLAKDEGPLSFEVPKEKLNEIKNISTEVYFWGIPSSGKTCAIGAILSVAKNGSAALSMSTKKCQGYAYMVRLPSIFNADGNVVTLPEGTSVGSTYEMGFDLEDENKDIHPITFIDLAGELIRCMYKSDAGEDLSNDEKEALKILTTVLKDKRTVHRKIHIFVMEYGADKRKYEGLSQRSYLDAALRYIERTEIFEKDTDAIYLMITKVDKANAAEGELQEKLVSYIKGQYLGFYNGLKKICRDFEINNGEVEILPFSLGEVCFQRYCMFSDKTAVNIIKKILVRAKGHKQGRAQSIFNLFKK